MTTQFDKVVVDHRARRSCGARARRSRSTTASTRLLPDAEKVERADYAFKNIGSLEELDEFVASVMRRPPGRVRRVVAALAGRSRSPQAASPSTSTVRARRGTSASATRSATRSTCACTPDEHGLDPALLAAVIYQESKFRPGARSPSGAIGLMQLTPSTARRIAIRTGGTAFRTERSVQPGDQHPLRRVVPRTTCSRSTASEQLVLAAYNAGQGNVDRWQRARARHPVRRDARVRDACRAPEDASTARLALELYSAGRVTRVARARGEREHVHAARPDGRA